MRKLYERLPDGITVNGRRYRLALDFRNVLRMMDVLERDDLLPGAREYHALRCVMKRPPRDCGPMLGAVMRMLFGGDRKPSGGDRITSFVQDADMIRAAMWQEYGVNLYRDRLHWFEFVALLQNLPSGNRYTDVLGIRSQEIPAANRYNAKEREALMRAKAACALELTEEEKQAHYAQAVHQVFGSLERLAGGE